MTENYYTNRVFQCLCSPEETRKESLKYWLNIHKKNVENKREDLIIFSEQMINSILYAEYLLTDKNAMNVFYNQLERNK